MLPCSNATPGAAADEEPRDALHAALAEAERGVSTLLAEAARGVTVVEEASLLRRLDLLVVALQRARRVVTAPRDALTVLPLALPLPLATCIWGALPSDLRLRCREVCTAWRDALAEPRLWTELELTATSGVVAPLTPALLRAAAARAGGQLKRLVVAYDREHHAALEAALLVVVAANADTLRLVRLEPGVHAGYISYDYCVDLLRAAPRQCVLEADVSAVNMYPDQLLRYEPPCQALRLQSLSLCGFNMLATDVNVLAAELAAYHSLRKLQLSFVPLSTFAALDAVVDAALALQLTKLEFHKCGVGPASAVALSRLLRVADALQLLLR